MDPQRRSQLPALSYLADGDKVKREDEYQIRHTGTGTPQSLSMSAGASPTYHYPPGPPPPYSHAHGMPPTNTWPTANTGVHTPPESRRTSENEKEGTKQRQSLPSISEALGIDRQTIAADPPPPLQPSHLTHSQTTAPSSPSPTTRRSYPMEPPQGPQPPYSATSSSFSQYSHYRSEPQQPSYPPPPETSRPAPAAYPPVTETKPPLQLQTSQPTNRPPPQPTAFPRPPEPSPAYEQQPVSTSAGSMGPPSSFPYGYTAYPPRYANPTPPSSTSSGPIYQPSVYSAPQPSQPAWKTADRSDDRQVGQTNYGDSVKRHLDYYDLEAALNEISATSGILSDFSRRYGDRMHQTQRSGATLKTLPGIVEVDDMISKSRAAHDSLVKIREVILQQQAAYEQQAADQRQQHKPFDQHPPQPEHHEQQLDEGKTGGFAGVDTKKRRGRAAPPGRCHSCNRAETPEWRRGPDGARTLCNACGLHYAKLTRKNNGTNKNANVGSSNLRPKENMAQ